MAHAERTSVCLEGEARQSTRSGGNGACVEVAELRTLIAVRDSKDPDGPKLLFPVAEWRSFTDAVQLGRFELGLAGVS
ncbi:MAG TPA: DUF397 domain-containing protein [Streptosporangiaceae bacterium]